MEQKDRKYKEKLESTKIDGPSWADIMSKVEARNDVEDIIEKRLNEKEDQEEKE